MKEITFDGMIKMFSLKEGPLIALDDCRASDNDHVPLDARILCTLAANTQGPCLEFGTSTGVGTFRMAANTRHKVITINILPQQVRPESGKWTTHILEQERIGEHFKARRHLLKGEITVVYADTARRNWQLDQPVVDSVRYGLAFIDGCHDTNVAYSDSVFALSRMLDGGFILWHDCADLGHPWIREVNRAVAMMEQNWKLDVHHIAGSWCAVARI